MHFLVDLHIAFVFYSFAVILLADKQALRWIRIKGHILNAERLHRYHLLTWLGLAGLIITGAILLASRTYLLSDPLFIMKLLFVGILVVNAILIGRLMEIATKSPYASLSRRELMPLFASGAFSVIGWAGALAIALVMF